MKKPKISKSNKTWLAICFSFVFMLLGVFGFSFNLFHFEKTEKVYADAYSVTSLGDLKTLVEGTPSGTNRTITVDAATLTYTSASYNIAVPIGATVTITSGSTYATTIFGYNGTRTADMFTVPTTGSLIFQGYNSTYTLKIDGRDLATNGGKSLVNNAGKLVVNSNVYLQHCGYCAVNNSGTFVLAGGYLFSNIGKDTSGGALVNQSGANFIMTSGYITQNIADYGGGGINNIGGGNVYLLGGSIGGSSANKNSANSGSGGGVLNWGYLYLGTSATVGGTTYGGSGCTISYNTTSVSGGGICNDYGSMTMDAGTVRYNTATTNGGGIFCDHGGTNVLNGGTISYNTAVSGGGICVMADTTFVMTSGNVANNSATYGGGIHNEGTVYLLGGTIGGGSVSYANTAAYRGGGVSNTGTLYLQNEYNPYSGTGVIIKFNTVSDNGDSTTGGGGIYNGGTATMSSGVVSYNTVNNSGNGGYGVRRGGGGIFNGSQFTLSGGYITYNDVNDTSGDDSGEACGGGIFNTSTLVVTAGTISNNSVDDSGGGIFWESGTVAISGGTISNNSAAENGGGLYVYSTLTMTGGTISGNIAANLGSGVYVLSNFNLGGTAYIAESQTIHLYNNAMKITQTSLLTNSSITKITISCPSYSSGTTVVTFSSSTYNTNQNLYKLADSVYGLYLSNSTTLAITAASSSYDLTYSANTGTGSNYTETRVAGNASKLTKISTIGFYKTGYVFGGWATTTNAATQTYSDEANYTMPGADQTLYAVWAVARIGTVYYTTLPSAVNASTNGQTVYLVANTTFFSSSTTISIPASKSITIAPEGDNRTIYANASGMIANMFSIASGATLTLTGNGSYSLSINGNNVSNENFYLISNAGTLNLQTSANLLNSAYGAVNNSGTMKMTGGKISGNQQETVFNSGLFTMSGGEISSNTTICGAAVHNSDGVFIMTGGTLSSNSASTYGGAIYNNSGTVYLLGGTISNNTSLDDGGGVYNEGYLCLQTTLTYSGVNYEGTGIEISNNTADSGGGGLYSDSSYPLTFDSGTFLNNTAEFGAGLYLSGTITINNLTIRENDASGNGGGIYIEQPSIVTIHNILIDSNTAVVEGGGIENRGTLTMNDGVISNNSSQIGGGIVNFDVTFTLNGGSITGNTSEVTDPMYSGSEIIFGGAGITNIGNIVMTGGTISNNISLDNGGGIVNLGTFLLSGGSIFDNQAVLGAGVYNVTYSEGPTTFTGTFIMENGSIYSNDASSNGGGVYNGSIAYLLGGTIGGASGLYANSADYYGGGIYNDAAGSLYFVTSYDTYSGSGITVKYNNAATSGAGVFNAGTFVMASGTIANNFATYGGGIYNNAGIAYLLGGTIGGTSSSYENSAASGGGVYNTGGGYLHLQTEYDTYSGFGIIIRFNNASINGGGIFNSSALTISEATISNNSATNGGGVYNGNGGSLAISGGTIGGTDSSYANSATSGGGIYQSGSAGSSISGGTISNNSAVNGGAIYLAQWAFNITGGSIFGNTASGKGAGVYVHNANGVLQSLSVGGTMYIEADQIIYLTAYLNTTYIQAYLTQSSDLTNASLTTISLESSYPVTGNTILKFNNINYSSDSSLYQLTNAGYCVYLDDVNLKIGIAADVTLNAGAGSSGLTSNDWTWNSGTNNFTKTLVYGDTFDIFPTDPTKLGYTFNGWWDGENGTGNQITIASAVPSEDTTYYANWTANTYNIAYNYDGGNPGTNIPATATYDSVFSVSAPTRVGYSFRGWQITGDVTYSTALYGNSVSPTTAYVSGAWASGGTASLDIYLLNLSTVSGGTVTLTAGWTPNKYSITFNATTNGGTADSIRYIKYGEPTLYSNSACSVIASAPTATKTVTGHTVTFNGWFTTASGAVMVMSDSLVKQNNVAGFTDASGNWIISTNSTVYAQFTQTVNTYSIAFNANTGVLSGTSPLYVKYNTTTLYNENTCLTIATIPTATKAVTGYTVTFTGWYTASSGGTMVVLANGTVQNSVPSYTDVSGNWIITSATTLYAHYTQVGNNYTITLSAGANASGVTGSGWTWSGVTYNYTKVCTFGGTIESLPTNPSKTGFTFNGFYTEENGAGTRVTSSWMVPANNATYYASFTAITNDVTYNYFANGGTSTTATPNPKVVNYGDPVDFTPTASKSGWTFIGWNTNSSATVAMSSLTMDTENITLFALYSKTLTATFIDYNGITQSLRTSSVTIYNTATSGTVLTPAQLAHSTYVTNRGWGTSTSADAAVTIASSTNYSISADITLYGLYSRTITITYNLNSGTSGAISNSSGTQYANSYDILVTSGADITITATTPTRAGNAQYTYTFSSWNSVLNGTGISYTPNTQYTFTNNATLYAVWMENINTYTVTLTAGTGANGSTSNGWTWNGGNQTFTKTYNYGSIIDLPSNPTMSGYSFANWFTSTNGEGTQLNLSSTATVNAIYYAKWTYTVSFDANGATGSASTASITITKGLTGTLANVGTMAKTGQTFVGWNTASNGTGTNYSAGASYLSASGDITLYAVWTDNEYAVTYSASGVTTLWNVNSTYYNYTMGNDYAVTFVKYQSDYATVSKTSGGTYGTNIDLPIVTKTGYTFNGWFTAVNGGTIITKNMIVTLTAPTTYYAQFNANRYLVNFDATTNGGALSGITPIYVEYNTNIAYAASTGTTAVAVPNASKTMTGYTTSFNGWFTSPNGGSVVYNESGVLQANVDSITNGSAVWIASGTITLYAQFTETGNDYQITLHTTDASGVTSNGWIWNDGAKTYTKLFAYGTTIGDLPTNPTLLGFAFNGWWSNVNGTGAKLDGSLTMGASDTSYYAGWTTETYTVTISAVTNGTNQDSTGGTVKINSGTAGATATEIMAYQSSVTLTASAKIGYDFMGWFAEVSGETLIYANAIYSFDMPLSDLTYYALFEIQTYQLTVTLLDPQVSTMSEVTIAVSQDGIVISPNSGSESIGIDTNATTSLTYTINYGWNVLVQASITGTKYNLAAGSVANAAVANTAQNSFTQSAIAQTVTFKLTELYTISYNGNGNTAGTVPATEWKLYDQNYTVSTNELIKKAYLPNGWALNSATGTGFADGQIYAQNADAEFFALWTEKPITVTVSSDEHGTITDVNGIYYIGEQILLSATPNEGYHFVSWSGEYDGTIANSNPTTYSMTENDAEAGIVNIIANFETDLYDIVIENTENGTVSPYGTYEYPLNQIVSITLTADDYYELTSVLYDGDEMISYVQNNIFAFSVEKDATVTITFSPKLWVNVYETPAGSGTKEDPYLIYTAEELAYISYGVNNRVSDGGIYVNESYIKLMSIIDLDDRFWTPIGVDSDGYRFDGELNFNYQKINDIVLEDDNVQTYFNGLFGAIGVGIILNITKNNTVYIILGVAAGAVILIVTAIVLIKKFRKPKRRIIYPKLTNIPKINNR